jgi:hypothetical protein
MAALTTLLRSQGDFRRLIAGGLATTMIAAALAVGWVVSALADLRPGPNEYNLATWEVRNFPSKWLYLAGELIRGTPAEADQDAALRRFFDLNAQIDRLAGEASDTLSRGAVLDSSLVEEIDALRKERDRLENEAEATIEARLSEVIKDQGLTRNLLWDVVWPPVDAEFTDAPRALARSPRDHIELLGATLLREDLTLAEAEAIEAEVAQAEDVSTLSFATAGIGAYPTIIDHQTDYQRALEVIAHEWMHNYLFFRPLGYNYYDNNDLRTINETVADLVGRELARAVVERWPLAATETPVAPATPAEPGLDLRAELRKLRGEVDVLLADGRIEDAEALMEQRRQELAGKGYFIRRINQAYFAYLNLYAGEAGSVAATNPIGPKVDALRSLSSSLRQFVDIVGNVTSIEELDRALLELE